MKVWLNGKLLDERRASLSVFDHGFLYGDGLYETVRVVQGRIALWKPHFKRFQTSARALQFRFPWSARQLEKAISDVASANRQSEASARITLSRGPGPLGLDPARCPIPTLLIQLHPPRDWTRLRQDGVSLAIVSTQRSSPESLSPSYKTTSMQALVRARIEARRLGVFEGILLNARGELTEGTISNLFFVRGRTLHTPALSCGLLPGITRAHILGLARRAGIRTHEGIYRAADVWQADELFLTNASFEILPVALLKVRRRTKKFVLNRPGAFAPRLHALLAIQR